MKASLAVLTLALGLGCAACASPPYLPARLANAPAVAGHAQHGEDTFDGARGIHLYEQWWRPSAPPKAVVIVVHGLKDHGSRYAELAERLVDRGFAVYAADLRGHGRSEGIRVYIDSWDDYLDDLDALFQRVKAREPGKPIFLFGHSMGGAVVTSYALFRRPPIAGLALSGAALRSNAPGADEFGAKLAGALSPKAGVFQLDLAHFSRDPEVVRACKADPLVYQPPAPARTARELLAAMERTGERMEELEVPLLVMHGSADLITPPSGSEELYRRARAKDKTLHVYPGLFHDILHEPEKETVLRDLVGWLDAHAGAEPTPPPPPKPATP